MRLAFLALPSPLWGADSRRLQSGLLLIAGRYSPRRAALRKVPGHLRILQSDGELTVQVNGDITLDPRQTERMDAIHRSADPLSSQRKAKTGMPARIVRPALPDRSNRDAPDVQTQFETLLDQVWRCEAEWRFDDRLDLATRLRR